MLALVEAAGVEPIRDMRLYTGAKERAFVERHLGVRRYAVIAPTSRWPGKRWPADRFAAVAESLLTMGFDAVALVGGKSERDQCAPLLDLTTREPCVLDLIGATTVGELMALVYSSALVIANDSAALHMAVGFDRPALGLFGPTRVDLVGPYGRDADVIQHVEADEMLDHKHDADGMAFMARIGVGEVISRVERILAGTRAVE
jgi:ADP-heptose:LPS heptosyltransferase